MHNVKIIALVFILTLSLGMVFAFTNNVLSNFDILPNPMEKIATVYVSLEKSVNINIYIEDAEGQVVKTIYSGNMASGNYEFVWNRLDNDGQYVTSGNYFIVVSYDTKYTSTKKTLILK